VAHPTGGCAANPGCEEREQAASNAEALSFSLVAAEIEALDRATTPWRE
jgi:diketogulonate reductase-like aldo/keto reductase